MNISFSRCLNVTVIAAGLAAAESALAVIVPAFYAVPNIPGPNSGPAVVHGLSGDGRVAFGQVFVNNRWEAMRWTASGGATAHGVGAFLASSYDASIMCGFPGRWTAATGWRSLPTPAGGVPGDNQFLGMSQDGSVIVGSARTAAGNTAAARWQSGTGVFLPMVLGSGVEATEVSADGSFMTGTWSNGATTGWASDGATSWLIDPRTSAVRDMTPDGSVIVGPQGNVSSAGYRLDLDTGALMVIPTLPGRQGGSATGVSADGATVCGWSGTTQRAYVWDQDYGTRSVESILATLGVATNGFIITEARAISDDGTVIAGIGIGQNGEQGWVAVIPAPGSLLGLSFLGVGFAMRPTRRR